MPIPPAMIAAALNQCIGSATKVLEARVRADRDAAIELYKRQQLALRDKLKAKNERAKIEADKQVKLAKVSLQREMIEVSKSFFSQLLAYRQETRDKIENFYKSLISGLQDEKKQCEERAFLAGDDTGRRLFYEKRLGELDLQVTEMTYMFTKAMTGVDRAIEDLNDPLCQANLPYIQKSIKMIEAK